MSALQCMATATRCWANTSELEVPDDGKARRTKRLRSTAFARKFRLSLHIIEYGSSRRVKYSCTC